VATIGEVNEKLSDCRRHNQWSGTGALELPPGLERNSGAAIRGGDSLDRARASSAISSFPRPSTALAYVVFLRHDTSAAKTSKIVFAQWLSAFWLLLRHEPIQIRENMAQITKAPGVSLQNRVGSAKR
jgi:hypothetical protein